MTATERLLVAKIGAAHGVRGEVRLTAFGDDPEALLDYGALSTADGRSITIAGLRLVAGRLVARIDGVRDRNAAEPLAGTALYIERDRLPPTEDDDTFYHADLIGLAVFTAAGKPLGTIVAVPNYGAGDLIEIAPPVGATLLVPFTRAIVPSVDVAAGRVVVDPPAGLLPDDGDDRATDGGEADDAPPDDDGGLGDDPAFDDGGSDDGFDDPIDDGSGLG